MGGSGQMLCSCGSFSMYTNGFILTWRIVFLQVNRESRLGAQIWNLMPSGFCREECNESGEGLDESWMATRSPLAPGFSREEYA